MSGRAPSLGCCTGLLSKSPVLPMHVLCNATQLLRSCLHNFCWLLLLQDHYKGYKHQRLVARHKAALHSQGYHHPHTFDSSPRRMPFTPSHPPPGPHPSDAGFLSPVRSPYSHPADRWSRGYAAPLHGCMSVTRLQIRHGKCLCAQPQLLAWLP